MGLSYFRRPNSAALAFIVAGAIWFVIGTVYGSFSAIHKSRKAVLKTQI